MVDQLDVIEITPVVHLAMFILHLPLIRISLIVHFAHYANYFWLQNLPKLEMIDQDKNIPRMTV